MSRRLLALNPDLQRIVDDGYEVSILAGHLVLSHVPYVNASREVRFGKLVSTLALAGDVVLRPDTHVTSFAGEHPCEKDGAEIRQIKSSSAQKALAEGLVVDHSFSNKPAEGYASYYEKMTTYVEIISAPARALDPSATAKTHVIVPDVDEDSPFVYLDSASPKSGIEAINAKLKDLKIAIIGLGGTGAYILDLIAKTPVAEIHLFDDDGFDSHNAFRAPGAAPLEELRSVELKVARLRRIYSNMHKRVLAHPIRIHEATLGELDAMNFAFVCIDKGTLKPAIFRRLRERGIPFLDVGMGIVAQGEQLFGTIRTTTGTPVQFDHLGKRISFADDLNDDYATNIQIAELNMLNAAFAVIKWKKLCGVYGDFARDFHTTYTIETNLLLREDADA